MRARFCAIFLMIALICVSIFLLLFACFHWHNFWSLFVPLPCFIAFFVPAICFGYTPVADIDMQQVAWQPDTVRGCREMGWCIAVMILICAYGIPVLAWYNDRFALPGACMVMVSLTAAVWSFLLWLRVFVDPMAKPN